MATTGPDFSLIIPAHNEEKYLPRLLTSIDKARERYKGGREAIEVIVADNVSTDGTAQIARSYGCQVVTVERRAIAAARNGGARAAHGEILAFVDADTQIHPDTFNEISRVLATGRVIGGATGIRFERMSLGLSFTYVMLIALAVLLGRQFTRDIPTGVVFCRRRDFEHIGGYNEERLYAEDVQFFLELKRLARKRNQQVACGTKTRAIFSTRKFDKYGEWHYFVLPIRMVEDVLRGRTTTSAWVRDYWYEDRDVPESTRGVTRR